MADLTVFTGCNHICVVTGDLDRAIRAWSERYGIGPWGVWTKDPSNSEAEMNGRRVEFSMRVALASLSPTFRLELIQPLDGPSPYAESLERHRGADHVHHVRLDVAEYASARDRLAGLGNEIVFDAWFDGIDDGAGRAHATYFATDDELGLTLEIADLPPGFTMPEPERIHTIGKEQP